MRFPIVTTKKTKSFNLKIFLKMDTSGMVDRTSNAFEEASTLAALANATQESSQMTQMSSTQTMSTPSTTRAQTTTVPASAIQVGPGMFDRLHFYP